MAEPRAAATRGAPRVAAATRVGDLEGATVELIDLNTERQPNRVALRFGDDDASVSLTDDFGIVWALIVEADRQLARLADRRRPQ